MKKRFAAIFLALVVSAFSLTGCTKSAETSSSAEDQSSYVLSEDADSTSVAADEYFAEGDLRDVESEEANAVITLSGSAGELSDTTRGSSGSDVTITSKGIYEITGSSENVTITVNDSNKSGNVYLVLNGVSMNNSDDPCIVVEQSEKVIIVCKGDNNTLRYTNASNTDGLDGAVYSEDDITLTGSGKLSVESAKHGIVCKDDFKLTGSETSVSAAGVGVKASDSARIGSGALDEQVAEYVRKKKLEKSIRLFGSRSDIPDLLQALDLFFLPSKSEGFGLACLEASTAGLPCVVSDEFPIDINVTGNVRFVSLQRSVQEWTETLQEQLMNFPDRLDAYEKIQNSICSDIDAGKNLYEYYCSLLDQ